MDACHLEKSEDMFCTRKMVPIARRARSFLIFFFVCTYVRFQKQNRKEKEEETKQQTYQFTAR